MRRHISLGLLTTLFSALVSISQADAAVLTWNFGSSVANGNFSGSASNVSVSTYSYNAGVYSSNFDAINDNSSFTNPITNGAASTGYTGASGAFNFSLVTKAGASLDLANSTYLAITFIPDAGYTFSLSDFDFGIRSLTSGPPGPANYALYWYNGSLLTAVSGAGGSISANSTWTLKNNTFSSINSNAGESVTLRLYLWGNASSSTSGNTRIDDITLSFALNPIPEPSPSCLLALGLFGIVALRRRF